MTTITVFKAQDGRWTYCPVSVRNWPAFKMTGQFDSKDDALQAVERDETCKQATIKVEAGFFRSS